MDEPNKISHSRYILSSLYFWSDTFADTDRVTAENIGLELETFAQILGFGFQHEGEIEQSIELWLKLFSMSHKHKKTSEWLPVIPVAIEKINAASVPLNLKILLLNRMGQVYRIENLFKLAEELHQKALVLYKRSKAKNDYLLADCNLHLAENYLLSNYPELALPYIEKVVNTPSFDGFRVSFKATALVMSGLIFNRLQQFEKAVGQFKHALSLWKTTNDLIEMARTYSGLGHSYLGLKLYDAAHESFTKALNLFEGFPDEKARSLSNLGILHFYKNEVLAALDYWELADDLATDYRSSIKLEAEVKHNIGVANRSLERYKQGEAYFVKAIKLWEMFENKMDLARSYGGLGETYLLWGKYQLAIEQYDLAIDLAKEYPSEKLFLEDTLAEREEARKKLLETKTTS